MLQAMLAGVASIKAQQTRMNVIGNNLANINTTAYKSSRVTFQDMLAETVRGASRPTGPVGGQNPIQYGLGVLVGSTDTNNEQGSLNATNRPTDLAIQGNGYFLVSDGNKTSYTRDGSFDLDANGDLVHRATGERVLGWDFVKQGNTNSNTPITPASAINIPLGRLNAVQQTTKVNFSGNLSGSATVGSSAAAPDTTSSARVYDGQGGGHDIQIIYFDRQDVSPAAANGTTSQWDWIAQDTSTTPPTWIGGSDTTGAPVGTVATGSKIQFDSSGKFIAPASLGTATITLGTTTPFTIKIDFSSIGQLKTTVNGTASSQVTLDNQDGFPPGSLSSFSIGQDGTITGLFTNGLTRSMGQVATAIFPNPGGLSREGSNLWSNSDNSGIPVIGQARSGGRGTINSGFLEQSNVDMSSEFTDLIITQRGYQANTKVVTTVDEMLQDLIQMKR